MVGIDSTPESTATSGRSSVHTSQAVILLENCFVTSFTTGMLKRHGPHHGAVKKHRTGWVAEESSCEKSSADPIRRPPDLLVFTDIIFSRMEFCILLLV